VSEFKAKGKDVTLEILNNSLLAVQGASFTSVNTPVNSAFLQICICNNICLCQIKNYQFSWA